MRRIMTFNHVSADGYFSRLDGSLDWFVPDEELDGAAAGSLREADTMLFGRKTYELFASYWPSAVDDSPTAEDPHNAGRRTSDIRAMAVWLNESTKLVLSRTLKYVTWQNTRLLGELDPSAIAALKEEPGGDIIIFGSGSIASQLTAHGLIDEYRFIVDPVLLGSGQPLLRDVPDGAPLRLVEATTYRSGNVQLRYERTA